jgi:hypothetical protein
VISNSSDRNGSGFFVSETMNAPRRKPVAAGAPKHEVLWRLAPFGAFGALLPAIVALGSHTDAFAFTPAAGVLIGQTIYVSAAALLSAIFPYGRQATPFNAALVGITFPSIVGAAFGTARLTFPVLAQSGVRGGVANFSSISWLIDALALF